MCFGFCGGPGFVALYGKHNSMQFALTRCLGKTIHISVAFVSQISEKIVLGKAGTCFFTDALLRSQLVWLVRWPEPQRGPFTEDGCPQISRLVRRVGWPRWVNDCKSATSASSISHIVGTEMRWRHQLKDYCLLSLRFPIFKCVLDFVVAQDSLHYTGNTILCNLLSLGA